MTAKPKTKTAKAASAPPAKTTKKTTEKKVVEEKAADKKGLPKTLVRVEALANFVGVTVRRIQQLQQEGVIKPEPGGNKKDGAKYDFLPCLNKIITYYRERADKSKSGDSKDMEAEKLRLLTVKRETEELKLAEMKGDLHRTDDIETVVGAAVSRLRISLLAIPMGVAPVIRGKENINEIAEIITERLSKALNEMVNIDIDKLLAEEKSFNPEE
jgi:phage terminase Nu1 subunit (DNA packaging protein)